MQQNDAIRITPHVNDIQTAYLCLNNYHILEPRMHHIQFNFNFTQFQIGKHEYFLSYHFGK